MYNEWNQLLHDNQLQLKQDLKRHELAKKAPRLHRNSAIFKAAELAEKRALIGKLGAEKFRTKLKLAVIRRRELNKLQLDTTAVLENK